MTIRPSDIKPAFYDHLLPWDELSSLLDHFETEERQQALTHILEAVDLEIMSEILHHLDSSHHVEFLGLCLTRHHHPSVLEWLEARISGIADLIKNRAKATHSQLHIILVTGS